MTIRNRYLRMFVTWHDSHRNDLPIPLTHRLTRESRLEFGFRSYPEALFLQVRPAELTVGVRHHGEIWDFLVSTESYARHTSEGYLFDECETPGKRWPTREQLWIEHDFNTLWHWIGERLRPAKFLTLQQHNSSTFARLSSIPVDTTAGATEVVVWELP